MIKENSKTIISASSLKLVLNKKKSAYYSWSLCKANRVSHLQARDDAYAAMYVSVP